MVQRVHNGIFFYGCMALAFFIPVFGRVLPPIIIVMFFSWASDRESLRNLLRLFRDGDRIRILSLASLYMVYALGMFFTSNVAYGLFDLEVKLSLFVFPLLFATIPFDRITPAFYRNVLLSFVAGSAVGSVVMLVHAAISYIPGSGQDAFTYTKLSWVQHPSYLSIYLTFAMAILMLWLLSPGIRKNRWITAIILTLILFFSVVIVLLASKAGILATGMLIGLAILYALFRIRKPLRAVLIAGISLLFMATAWFVAPGTFSRFTGTRSAVMSQNSDHTPEKAESNADRVAVWKTSVSIIRAYPWFGVGTGDVKDALLDGYRERHNQPAIDLKLNAHNQYLQTFIATGLPGFLLLVAMLLLPAIRALRTGDDLYLAFLLVFGFNILVESMFEMQAGVIFFAFFNVLLFTSGTVLKK